MNYEEMKLSSEFREIKKLMQAQAVIQNESFKELQRITRKFEALLILLENKKEKEVSSSGNKTEPPLK